MHTRNEAAVYILTTTTTEGRSAMNKSFIFFFTISLFLLPAVHASDLSKIKDSAVMIPQALSTVKLLHNQDKFVVSDDDGLHEIENCWLDSDLRKIANNAQALERFQDVGYIEVKKDDKGQYLLKSHVRALGGGPGFGLAVFWTVKATLYAAISTAAVSTAVVGTVTTGGIGTAAAGTALSSVIALGGAASTATVSGVVAGAAVGTTIGTVAPAAVVMATGGAAMAGAAAGVGGATGAWASAIALDFMITAVATAAGLACGMTPTP